MALAIKNTPVLEGKTSEHFNKMIVIKTVVSKERILEIKSLTKTILSNKKSWLNLSDFTFSELKESVVTINFDCGDGDLNDFLCNDSTNYQNQLIAKTYLFSNQNGIVAFFSISNDVLTDKGDRSIWNRLSRKIPNQKRKKVFPAVKLGRLGVSNIIQSGGLGKQIIQLIIGLVLFESKSASRFLIVDAYNNERTIKFYNNNGFQFLLGDKDVNESTRIMFLDLLPYWNAINLN